ncbi:cation:proton antiporter [Phaeacidiphilus oryzae]|uniref:cation:proton antiporter n=1 Tax=Phaeacidiphilus oryzae TaxID=348818 RepID=UPI00068C2BE9|nr:cation:proton antiporter [Phaeacidiphilus oryzae]
MNARQLDWTTTVVIADVAVILLAGVLLAGLARRVRQPPVVAELLAGVALGPSLLGLLPGHLSSRLFPEAGRPFLSVLSQLGILLFMFLIGWEFNRDMLRGRLRGTVLSVSLSSLALPFAGGVALALALYGQHDRVGGQHVGRTAFVLYVGTAVSITAFPVLARFLVDSGLGGTRVGGLALASAAVCDALSWLLLAAVVAVAQAAGPAGLLRTAAELAGYLLVVLLAVRPALRALVRRWDGRPRQAALAAPVAAGVLLSAAATSWLGIHAIFGAFLFGCVMPREPLEPLIRQVRVPLEQVSRLLLPVFFIQVGLSVDIRSLSGGDLLAGAAITAVACAGKLLGAVLPARLTGLGWREAGRLGALMNMRGLTELIVLQVGAALGVLDDRLYTLMVLMALATTAATGLFVRHRPPESRRPPERTGDPAEPASLSL